MKPAISPKALGICVPVPNDWEIVYNLLEMLAYNHPPQSFNRRWELFFKKYTVIRSGIQRAHIISNRLMNGDATIIIM